MKKYIIPLAVISTLSLGAFAEPASVECSTNPSFGTNSCEVCYTDSFNATATPEGFTSNITSVKIPWKHNGGELDEIIYDNEQKFPEIKSSIKVTTKPEKPEELWTSHESLIWTPFSDHKEVFIKDGEEIGLYKLQDKAGITVTGKKADDTIMFVTPLVVRDFDAKTNEDSDPTTRNICVMGKFTMKTGATPAPTTTGPIPAGPIAVPTEPSLLDTLETITTSDALDNAAETLDTETTEEDVDINVEPAFNAAGPEATETITSDQTATETGPALWVALLLAFAIASGWNAWKKQQA
ncbi:hypothetical protein KBB89_03990 [Candidatus Gracilibacteria bacterium]|nr:hypothetical protein [Candidatus Gracilibacteria bacterium]